MDLSGDGVDSRGEPVDVDSLPFEETALKMGQSGYSDVYIGDSGRLQITFQTPVYLNGEQVGALYADKAMSSYKDPSLLPSTAAPGFPFIVDGRARSRCRKGYIQNREKGNSVILYVNNIDTNTVLNLSSMMRGRVSIMDYAKSTSR